MIIVMSYLIKLAIIGTSLYEGKLFDLPKYIDVKDIYFITNHNLMIDERYVNYHP